MLRGTCHSSGFASPCSPESDSNSKCFTVGAGLPNGFVSMGRNQKSNWGRLLKNMVELMGIEPTTS